MIIIVEGKNDANKLKSVLGDVNVITTNGSEINKQTINDIIKASKNHEIVLCLDPDGPGEKIRKTIVQYIPNASHVFAIKDKAISKNHKKVGIEHMTKEDILELFSKKKQTKNGSDITYLDLYDLGYMDNKQKRINLCNKLNISYCNGKQLLKRLNMFGITKKELIEYDC